MRTRSDFYLKIPTSYYFKMTGGQSKKNYVNHTSFCDPHNVQSAEPCPLWPLLLKCQCCYEKVALAKRDRFLAQGNGVLHAEVELQGFYL
jgi:hypothetical protein